MTALLAGKATTAVRRAANNGNKERISIERDDREVGSGIKRYVMASTSYGAAAWAYIPFSTIPFGHENAICLMKMA